MSDGILVIDKPAGWTSFDVVAFVRRRCGVKRVGHAGTLDPIATGVLPVFLGQATRLVEYLVDAGKSYRARIELGVDTDTYDADGEVVSRADPSGVARSDVERALASFRGWLEQVPPKYSAIKRAGVPAYKLARKGAELDLEPRRVRVDRLELAAFEPPYLDLEVDCSKGFYVRSLAHDLGQVLGVGATMTALMRSRVGSFELAQAVSVEDLRRACEEGSWQELLWAADEVLLDRPAAVLSEEDRRRLLHGRDLLLRARPPASTDVCRAYDGQGEFLAVMRWQPGAGWRPHKVLAADGAR